MAKKRNPLISCAKDIAISFAMTFAVMVVGMIVSVVLLGALLYGDGVTDEAEQHIKNIMTDIIMMVAYAVCFYRTHMASRLDGTHMEHGEKMDVKGELKAYIRGEGKYLFLFYGFCAVVNATCGFAPWAPVRLIGTIFTDVILGPLFGYLFMPILSSVLAFLYACLMTCALEMLRSYRVHRRLLVLEERRRER